MRLWHAARKGRRPRRLCPALVSQRRTTAGSPELVCNAPPLRLDNTCPRRGGGRRVRGSQGFSLMEMVVTVGVAMVIAAAAIPMTQGAMRAYRLNSAASSGAGAIQSVRYRAIMLGYPCAIAFLAAANSYQVSCKVPPAVSFTNVGGPIPLSGSGDVMVEQATTLEFSPGGTVRATLGSLTLSLTDGQNRKTITVSGVGNVSVSQ